MWSEECIYYALLAWLIVWVSKIVIIIEWIISPLTWGILSKLTEMFDFRLSKGHWPCYWWCWSTQQLVLYCIGLCHVIWPDLCTQPELPSGTQTYLWNLSKNHHVYWKQMSGRIQNLRAKLQEWKLVKWNTLLSHCLRKTSWHN